MTAIAHFVASALLLICASVQAGDRLVGNRSISIVAPPGFVDVTAATERLPLRALVMIPPTNRLLAFYLPSADAAKLQAAREMTLHRYLQVQTVREFEGRGISLANFGSMRRDFASQQADLVARNIPEAQRNLDAAAARLRESLYDSSLAIKIGEVVSLGVFLDTPNAVGSTAVTRYASTRRGEASTNVVAAATSIVRLRDRLVFVYAYSVYESRDDVRWVEDTARQWTALLVRANGGVP